MSDEHAQKLDAREQIRKELTDHRDPTNGKQRTPKEVEKIVRDMTERQARKEQKR